MFEIIRRARLMKQYQTQLEAELRLADLKRQGEEAQAEKNKNVPPMVLIEAAAILWRNERKNGAI